MSWHRRADDINGSIRSEGRWRAVRTLDGDGTSGKLEDGRSVVTFASNDYLGLTQHPAVKEAARDALDRWGTGSGSARLIVGGRPIHDDLEAELADWKATEHAVLFPSGYSANLGVLSTFGHKDATIYSDELNHASIVDACRMARAEIRIYPHSDLEKLASMLRTDEGPSIVISDAVFSMDGDTADVDGLIEVCAGTEALLILDEAHSVLGPIVRAPSGSAVIRVGTLSKFLGSAGGFVACDTTFADALINSARSYIFTTAGTPADSAAALAALRIIRSDEGERLLARLRAAIDRVMPGHPSPIVPLIIGSERDALAASQSLLDRGYLVPAIRPPSVPHGSARLRVTLSAAHTDEQIDGLLGALSASGVTITHG